MKHMYVIAATLGLFSVLALPAHAEQPPETQETEASTSVFISEINWAGSALSTADEWIELFNPTSSRVDLGGWVLTGAATSGDALAIENGFGIEAGSTALISNYPFGNEKTTLDVAPDLVTSSLSLPNSDLHIMLTTPEGVVIDEVTSEEQMGSSKNNFISMERVGDTWVESTESVNLQDSTQLGTPGYYVNVSTEPETAIENTEVIDTNSTTEQSEPAIETETDITDSTATNDVPADESTDSATENTGTENILETEVDTVNQETDIVNDAENSVPSDDLEDAMLNTPDQSDSDVNETTEQNSDVTQDVNIADPEPEADTKNSDDTTNAVNEIAPEENADTTTSTATNVPTPASTTAPTPAFETTAIYNQRVLQINEVVSDPSDGTEWVEIRNTGLEPIHLLGWGLMEGSGKLTAFPDDVIAPGGYYIVEDPAGNLNNGGDSVYIYDPNGIVIDEMTYGTDEIPAPKKNQSLILQNDEWVITDTLTKGADNPQPVAIALVEPIQTEPYENIDSTASLAADDSKTESKTDAPNNEVQQADSNLSDDSAVNKVVAIASSVETKTNTSTKNSSSKSTSSSANKTQTLTGIVTALPGTFGDQVAFIQGSEIYSYYGDWPLLALGDIVTINGESSTSRGEDRLKTSSSADIVVVQHGSLIATTSDIGAIGSLVPGTLAEVHGTIEERDSNSFTLQDETGTIEIVIHPNTGIVLSGMNGGEVTVTGVLRKFGTEYRLYPRSQNDLVIPNETDVSTKASLATAGSSKPTSPWIGGGLVATAVGALVYWYVAKNGLRFIKPQNTVPTTA